jgi:hypothetical protein
MLFMLKMDNLVKINVKHRLLFDPNTEGISLGLVTKMLITACWRHPLLLAKEPMLSMFEMDNQRPYF